MALHAAEKTAGDGGLLAVASTTTPDERCQAAGVTQRGAIRLMEQPLRDGR